MKLKQTYALLFEKYMLNYDECDRFWKAYSDVAMAYHKPSSDEFYSTICQFWEYNGLDVAEMLDEFVTVNDSLVSAYASYLGKEMK